MDGGPPGNSRCRRLLFFWYVYVVLYGSRGLYNLCIIITEHLQVCISCSRKDFFQRYNSVSKLSYSIFISIMKGASADAGPHYQKLYGRVTDVCSNRRGQPKLSAMRGPHSGRNPSVISFYNSYISLKHKLQSNTGKGR